MQCSLFDNVFRANVHCAEECIFCAKRPLKCAITKRSTTFGTMQPRRRRSPASIQKLDTMELKNSGNKYRFALVFPPSQIALRGQNKSLASLSIFGKEQIHYALSSGCCFAMAKSQAFLINVVLRYISTIDIFKTC